jgi:hypothetical protein
MVGIRFGGPLSEVVDRVTQLAVNPRSVGDFSLVVCDPARLVVAMLGMSSDEFEPVLRWVKGLVLRQLGAAVFVEVDGGKSVRAPDLIRAALHRVAGELGELESSGLAVTGFGEVLLSFSEEDIQALTAATKKIAMAKLEESKAQAANKPPTPPSSTFRCSRCFKEHDAGRFCVECGGPLEPS